MVLAVHGQGESFGERSLLTRAPVSATVQAAEDIDLLRLDPDPVRQLLERTARGIGAADRNYRAWRSTLGLVLIKTLSALHAKHAVTLLHRQAATRRWQRTGQACEISQFSG